LLQASEVCISQRTKPVSRVVHSVPNTVCDDDIARQPQRLYVSLGLFECALHARSQTLSLDYEVTVLRNTG
jgi:hypothetical protein